MKDQERVIVNILYMASLIYELVKLSLKVQFVTPRAQAVQNLETSSSSVRQIEVSVSSKTGN